MSQTTDAVIAELMDRRLLNDVDSDLHQEIAEAVIKAAQPAVDEDGPLSIRDLAMIDQAWENYKAALPVATVVNDNQPGRTAIIEITIDPPTLPVGTKLYAGPKMVELAAETSPGDVTEKVDWTPFEDGTAPWPEDEQFEERAKACKSRCKQYGYTCGQGGEEDYEYEGECDDCDRDAQEVLRKKYLKPAAIDRLDVKAEAKSQEPDADQLCVDAVALNDQDEVLLAYGLLWSVSTTDKRVHSARRELLKCLNRELQAKAISAARTTMALVRDIRQMKGAAFASDFDAPSPSGGDAHGDGYCGCTERCKDRDNCQYDVKPVDASANIAAAVSVDAIKALIRTHVTVSEAATAIAALIAGGR